MAGTNGAKRGGANGGGGSGAGVTAAREQQISAKETSGRSLTRDEILSAEKSIDKKGFTNLGGGNWEFTGPYTIGAQILDESGSNRVGFATKAYSIRTWKSTESSSTRYFSSLNAAKTAAKEEMKEWLSSVTIFS